MIGATALGVYSVENAGLTKLSTRASSIFLKSAAAARHGWLGQRQDAGLWVAVIMQREKPEGQRAMVRLGKLRRMGAHALEQRIRTLLFSLRRSTGTVEQSIANKIC